MTIAAAFGLLAETGSYFGGAIIDNIGLFVQGMLMTVNISFWAMLVSFVVGLIVAVLRVTPSGGLSLLAATYTEFFRNTPLVVQVMAFYFGLPVLGVHLSFSLFGIYVGDAYAAGTLALALYTGAYTAETIRAGLLAVPKGQREASYSLALSTLQTLRLIIIPQAIRMVLPPLANVYSAMLKNSAILAYIGVADLMFQADYVNNRTFRTFEVLTAVVVFYLMLTLPLAWFSHWLDAKFNPLRSRTLRLRGARD
ncbi:MAG TPA: amino acid ABC transporter permease [Chthoniobacterales bacterium]